MAKTLKTAEHTPRAHAREGIGPCRACFTDGAGQHVLCPHHSRFEPDGTPREATGREDLRGGDMESTTAQQAERAATLLAVLAGDARPFVAAFDYELNASGLSGRKRAYLFTLIRLTYKGKASAYAGVARSTVSLWRKEDATFLALERYAEELLVEVFEAELDRRAFEGVDKPVFGKLEGKDSGSGKIGIVKEYSDRLAEIRMRALAPERYRERAEKGTSTAAPNVERLRADIAAKLKRAADVKMLSPASVDDESEKP